MSPLSPEPGEHVAPERASDERLDSWKEIASHLDRDVRTAQRWEKTEGLPVHRHVHGQRGTVFAYRSEVDRWREKRTSPAGAQVMAGASDSPENDSKERSWGAALLVAVVAVAALTGARFLIPSGDELPAAASPEDRLRLLVLPFSSASGDFDEEPLRHGLLEELISRLAHAEPTRLSVIGRTSSLRFGTSGLGLAEMAERLAPIHVLEGSIRRSAGKLRVTVRLVRAREEDELWSQAFDVEERDLPGTEQRVARTVAEAVERELFGNSALSSSLDGERSAAYGAWLRGRYLGHKGTEAGYLSSLAHYREALDADPDFVPAHVGLAEAYGLLGRYGHMRASEAFPPAREAALAALELEPGAAGAHAVLGMVSFYFERDFESAAVEFQEALRLEPGIALTHHVYGHFLSCLGLHEEALREVQEAKSLEPLWPVVGADAAWFYYRARRFEDAARESREALALEPELYSATLCLVASLKRLGRHAEAWQTMRAHLDTLGLLAQVPGLDGGDPVDALYRVRTWSRERVEERARAGYVSPYSHVFSLTGLGRSGEVLDWLEEGIRTGDRITVLMKVHPSLDELRESARFRELLGSVGFPDDPQALIDAARQAR